MQKWGEAQELKVPSAARQELSCTIITIDVAVVLQLGHIWLKGFCGAFHFSLISVMHHLAKLAPLKSLRVTFSERESSQLCALLLTGFLPLEEGFAWVSQPLPFSCPLSLCRDLASTP